MVTLEDVGKALMRCSGYAPQIAPQPSEAVAAAWMEHFGDYPGVTGEDLMKAVKEFFRVPRERQVQPADISAIARKYARERFEASDLDSPERLALEAKCDSKAAPELSAVTAAAPKEGGGIRSLPPANWKGRAALKGQDRLAEIKKFNFAPNPLLEPPDPPAVLAAKQREAAPPTVPPCPDCAETQVPCSCDKDSA